jgi:hypothetical protein
VAPYVLKVKEFLPKREILFDEIFATTEKYENALDRCGPKK